LPTLDGRAFEDLHTALVDALPEFDDWEQVAKFGLGRALAKITAPARLDAVALKVLTYTEARNETDALVAAALKMSPKNELLRAAVERHRLNSATRFESIVQETVAFLDVVQWRTDMQARESAVCRIEENLTGLSGQDEPLGTGFLIGEDVVITNHHVVRAYINRNLFPEHLTFRFDYKGATAAADPAGIAVGTSEQWLVAESESLDYAMIRLAEPLGAAPRRFIEFTERRINVGDPLMIIQHPKAVPLVFAMGRATAFDNDGGKARIRYNVNTQDGSSGSPCFDGNWSLIALHSSGGITENEGVLFGAIQADLRNKNVAPAR
jgi:V8-like Glu-specific endopeptidase